MNLPNDASILTHFANLDDPRDERGKEHLLVDIVTIAICAVICGAESWTDIEEYGRAKINWLSTFLTLLNGIPYDVPDKLDKAIRETRCTIGQGKY